MVRRPTKWAMAAMGLLVIWGCAPRGKSYGPVSEAAQAEQIARSELKGSALADGPFEVVREGANWVVAATDGSNSARFEIDAKTGRLRSFTSEVTDVAIIGPSDHASP